MSRRLRAFGIAVALLVGAALALAWYVGYTIDRYYFPDR